MVGISVVFAVYIDLDTVFSAVFERVVFFVVGIFDFSKGDNILPIKQLQIRTVFSLCYCEDK